jgi:hypothetical protein
MLRRQKSCQPTLATLTRRQRIGLMKLVYESYKAKLDFHSMCDMFWWLDLVGFLCPDLVANHDFVG